MRTTTTAPQLDKAAFVMQDYSHDKSSGAWRYKTDMPAGADTPQEKWTYSHKPNGSKLSLFDAEVQSNGHAMVRFCPAHIALDKVESVLRSIGLSTELKLALVHRFDLQRTLILLQEAYAYHEALNIAARKQRADLRHGSTWYSNAMQSTGVQVTFYDAARKHKHLDAGSMRLEARIQGLQECRSRGFAQAASIYDMDTLEVFRSLVLAKLPHIEKIELKRQSRSYQTALNIWQAVQSEAKRGGRSPLHEFLELLGIQHLDLSIDQLQRLISDTVKDKQTAYRYRKTLREVVSRSYRYATPQGGTATIAQELRRYIAA